jgi:hypothetical protein
MMHAKTKQALLGCLMFACGAVVASLAFARPPQAVEHAPTVEQCQADRAYWMSKLEQPDDKGVDDVSYDTLNGWHKEMSKCEVVDPSNYWKYYNAMGESNAEQLGRMIDFLSRHNLWQQFLDEDAAGKR